MKRILFIIAFLFSFSAFSQAPATPTDCTNAFFKGMLDEDAALIEKNTASDFIIVSYDGMMAEKDLVIQGVSGGFVSIETGEVSGLQVRSYNDNTAVVTGTWKVKGSIQGNPLTGDIIFTAVCIKNANNWQMVNMQFTPAR
jgi:signal transduction histidine kinase